MMLNRFSRKFVLGLVGFASLAIVAVSGCSNDKSTSKTNENSDTFQPKGTIQGVVRDAVTLQPIVNAVVSVDIKSATTDDLGSYVIKDVPATTDGLNGTVAGFYQMEVDLSSAYTEDELGNRDVDMSKDNQTPRYPRVAYNQVNVFFTSLNDTECSDSADNIDTGNLDDPGQSISFSCTNSSNHDTPVDGLVAQRNFNIGKLACNIVGHVYGCENTAAFATAQSGYSVKLVNDSCVGGQGGNTGTGQCGNVIGGAADGLATTDANGEFTFSNVECGAQDYLVVAADSFTDPNMDDSLSITGPFADGETLVLDIEHDDNSDIPKDTALHVCINDSLGPQIIAVSPEPGSDLAPTSGETVTITFHEPIAQNAYTDVTVSGVGNLYEDLLVDFDGQKVGNIPHTMAWNAAGTVLTITFDTGTSGLYRVTLPNVGTLTDEAGNSASPGVCPIDAPGPWSNSEGGGAGDDDCVVYFSTTGGISPTAPSITLVNAANLDEADGGLNSGTDIGSYDWLTTAGAKDYQMFCRKVQVWEDGTSQVHQYVADIKSPDTDDGITTSGSSATVDFDSLEEGADFGEGDSIAFVENSEIALKYDCYVAGLSSDGVLGPASNVVRAEDKVGPVVVESGGFGDQWFCGAGAVTGGLPTSIGGICSNGTDVDQLVVGFNENLREGTAETTTNYTFQGLATGGTAAVSTVAADSPVYNAATNMVLLTLSDTLTPEEIAPPVVRTGTNGLLETTNPGGDTTIVAGINAGLASTLATRGLCVYGGGSADTVPLAGSDDAVSGANITVGPDGICDTTANNTPSGGVGGFDVQVVEVGARSGVCATEVTGGADIAESGDDVDEDTGGAGTFTAGDDILAGVNGICDTLATDVTAAAGVLRVAQGNGTPNSAGIVAGGDVELDTTTLNNAATCATVTCDDTFGGSSLLVGSGVHDVNNNALRDASTSPVGTNVYRADGTAQSQ